MLRKYGWVPKLNQPGIYEVRVIDVVTVLPYKGTIIVDLEGFYYKVSLHRVSIKNIYDEQLQKRIPWGILKCLEGLRNERIFVGIDNAGLSYTGLNALVANI